ncbi:MAG: phosphoribosylformylglycinamidine synthase subunit PurS [Actinomycetota bacterium]|nr:phosphoribosylformylglycinamidine synthase subunit PurS [Actinomycetota bacterium]
MRKRFEVVVDLKPGLADPQGRAIEDAAPTMGWTGVSEVRVGKHIALTVEAESEDAARTLVEEMSNRLLSNPVIEDFRILSMEATG